MQSTLCFALFQRVSFNKHLYNETLVTPKLARMYTHIFVTTGGGSENDAAAVLYQLQDPFELDADLQKASEQAYDLV